MPELDAFERSLETAFQALADRGVTPVNAIEFAERVAARPRPWVRLPWPPAPGRLAAVPATTWLLVLAGLLLVLVIGGLVAGARRDSSRLVVISPSLPQPAACPPGSAPDEPGDAGRAKPPLGGALVAAFDRDSAMIVALAAPLDDASASWGPWETWTYDVCSNGWLRPSLDREPGLPHPGSASTVHDDGSDVTVAIGDDAVPWVYEAEAGTWTPRSAAPVRTPLRLVSDPISGSILAVPLELERRGEGSIPHRDIWRYDVRRDLWARVPETTPGPWGRDDHLLVTYDPFVDRMVGVWAETRLAALLDPRTGVWAISRAGVPAFNTGLIASGGEIAFDEATGRSVVFSDGLVGLYDAAADRWEVASGPVRALDPVSQLEPPTGPTARLGHTVVYDPLNERLVVMGGQYRRADGFVRADDVWAFDTVTRGWIQLLASSGVSTYDEDTRRWVDLVNDGQP